jgi:hypothetical protein
MALMAGKALHIPVPDDEADPWSGIASCWTWSHLRRPTTPSSHAFNARRPHDPDGVLAMMARGVGAGSHRVYEILTLSRHCCVLKHDKETSHTVSRPDIAPEGGAGFAREQCP